MHRSIVKQLKKGHSVEIDGDTFIPYRPPTNPHRKIETLTDLRVSDKVICRLDGLLEIRVIKEIQQVNFLPRFKVGDDGDLKMWIGKTKIFGVKHVSDKLTIESI